MFKPTPNLSPPTVIRMFRDILYIIMYLQITSLCYLFEEGYRMKTRKEEKPEVEEARGVPSLRNTNHLDARGLRLV